MTHDFLQYFIDSLRDYKIILNFISPAISATSLYLTRRFWLSANRPIVSASIVSIDKPLETILYNLAVYNTGNRPATSIKIHASKENIDKIIDLNDSENSKALIEDIYKCFDSETVIPLLINGKEAFNSFGLTSPGSGDNVLKYNANLPIVITYSDLEHRKYKSQQVLVVRSSQGFAGGRWTK